MDDLSELHKPRNHNKPVNHQEQEEQQPGEDTNSEVDEEEPDDQTENDECEEDEDIDEEKGSEEQGGDEDKDEDMDSELSEGGLLQDELWHAINEAETAFQGDFYHASLLPYALNPCLSISELGLVSLPLSERDAKAIINCATLAPFGHGERTVVDKDVRDTWEIDPSKFSFGNTRWKDYIDKTLCVELCKSLGIAIGDTPPRMELYKLLLYETGSHFLPHQDTQKANGMFATAIILLPSAYTGGQVIVSHSTNTKVIDFSQESLQSSALLAWYTDVKHEVKPVTSGYRLALAYNLIQDESAGLPLPCLPETAGWTSLLRRVLKKWKDNRYDQEGGSEKDIMACLLDHQYSSVNLTQGLNGLKGADRSKAAQILPIAEELGFKVGLAKLEHNISGTADDDGCNYYRRSRYCYSDDDDDDDDVNMGEICDTTTQLSELVDLSGVPLLSVGNLVIDDECVVPQDPFEGKTPDETEYEGYMGNGAGSLEYWYRRTVLVLIDESKMDDIIYLSEGPAYGVRKLTESSSTTPTPQELRLVDLLITDRRPLNQAQLLQFLECTFKWKDLETLKNIVKTKACCTLGMLGTNLLLRTWTIFSFKGVSSIYEIVLARSRTLSEQIDFISSLPSKAKSTATKKAVNAWCKKETNKILSSYSSAEGVPYAFQVLKNSTIAPPAPVNRLWFMLIIRSGGQYLNNDQISVLFTYAFEWKDLELWKAVAQSPSCSLRARNLLAQACTIFSFEDVRVLFDTLIARSSSLADRINFILSLPAKASPSDKDTIRAWYQQHTNKILGSYVTLDVKEIPTFLGVIRMLGLRLFNKLMIPNIVNRNDNYALCIGLVKALHENRQVIVDQETKRMAPTVNIDSSPSPLAAIRSVIKDCLQAAARQWNSNSEHHYGGYHYANARIGVRQSVLRIVELVTTAILIADMDICKPLFAETLKSAGSTVDKFEHLYCPLMPSLRKLLENEGKDICRSPFVEFVQPLIGLYLRDILGQKTPFTPVHLRKIGCGCSDCNQLDQFIFDSRHIITFRLVQARRTHLERQLLRARDLCAYVTIKSGSPHCLQVTKHSAVIEPSKWAHKQNKAKSFLSSIGSDAVISKIMGGRYADLKLALEGVKPFSMITPGSTVQVAGRKRKLP